MNQQVDNAIGGHDEPPAPQPQPVVNGFAPAPFWPRFWRVFGFGHAMARWDDVEGWAPGYIISDTYIKISWRDRFRILVSGKAMLALAIQTSCIVPLARSCSAFSVLPPTFKMERKQ